LVRVRFKVSFRVRVMFCKVGFLMVSGLKIAQGQPMECAF